MDAADIDEKNRLIDVLFDQIDALDDEQKKTAVAAVELWRQSKIKSFLGLGPMAGMHSYKTAYAELKNLGLEVGGMLPPCEC